MVDYCPTDIAKNPSCSHGPTLLFQRRDTNRKFYACSAFRSRKRCSFFLWEDNLKRTIYHSHPISAETNININGLDKQDQNWCHTCEILFISADKSKHLHHDFVMKIEDDFLQPSLLFKPKEESKGESQYFFSNNVVNFLLDIFSNFKISNVLCLGCPRLHEHIIKAKHMNSLLLDIDSRYFYKPSEFQVFNMFNCYMFNPEGWKFVKSYVSEGKTAIIADPPFGGRTEPLSCTFQYIESLLKECNNQVDPFEMLILPYFMEPAVKISFPNFEMLDYKIEYENHKKFKKFDHVTGSSKSAVRIFTNMNPSLFVLPSKEGYKYCDLCCRWVCKENRHCFACEDCTSKNGSTYRHCSVCQKCVKQTWKHCKFCKICKLMEHRCAQNFSDEDLTSNIHGEKRKRLGKKGRKTKKWKNRSSVLVNQLKKKWKKK